MSEIETNVTALEQQTQDIDYKAEFERLKLENDKLRKATTNASADASRFKKELQARMTEDERVKAEREEQTAKLQAELDALRKDKTVSEHKANFIGLGFGADMAQTAAEALADGNLGDMFNSLKAFITQRDKEHTAEAFRNTPKPTAGAVTNTITKEQFDNMGYAERNALYKENPDLYRELNK